MPDVNVDVTFTAEELTWLRRTIALAADNGLVSLRDGTSMIARLDVQKRKAQERFKGQAVMGVYGERWGGQ